MRRIPSHRYQAAQVVGESVGCEVFTLEGCNDPVKIAREAVKYAEKQGHDLVFLDTAGRLHVDEELMAELSNIKKETNPHEILLVIDAMLGQDAVNVAESFNNLLDVTGVILTKLDGDTRGGAALSARAVTGKPIKFVGTGEKLENLESFHPDRMASRILGMGDVLSLIEKASQSIDEKSAMELLKKTKTKRGLDLNDLLEQMRQLQNMGSIRQIMAMMPGGANIPDEAIDEGAFSRTEAIILSMTPKERERPDILDASRKRRIAAGCGLQVQDVNRLLRQFEQSNKMMKRMSKMGKRGGFGGKFPF